MRLIDADATIEDLYTMGLTPRAILERMERFIDAQPTIEERKTARDIYYTVCGHCEFKCSACGVEIGVVEGGELDGGYFKFCPNCGAKMESENE